MTNQQILHKAIQKAIDGGWRSPMPAIFNRIDRWGIDVSDGRRLAKYWFNWSGPYGLEHVEYDIRAIIFNHNFAKALWGEEWTIEVDTYSAKRNEYSGSCTYKAWQYHLQEMVIVDDPIKYLGENMQ